MLQSIVDKSKKVADDIHKGIKDSEKNPSVARCLTYIYEDMQRGISNLSELINRIEKYDPKDKYTQALFNMNKPIDALFPETDEFNFDDEDDEKEDK